MRTIRNLSHPLCAGLVLLGGCAAHQNKNTRTAVDGNRAGNMSGQTVSRDGDKHATGADLVDCRDLRVHFAFNDDSLADSDKGALEQSAKCLRADHSMRISIAGNADERGTEEYNLALGDRRAASVSKYLEALGVSPGQLKTVSFGKERPLCEEHDEACWARNRRADLSKTQK